MRTFLVVSPRPGHAVARAEFDDFLGTAGLDATEMEHYMLDSPSAQLPDLSRYAGVFIGGSPFNITNEHYSDHQLAVHEQMTTILNSPVPSLFVCFGTGFSQVTRGGEVGQTHPEVAGLTTVTLSDAASTDPLTAGVPSHFQAMTGHKENVVTPAPGSTVLATGPGGFVHMLRTHEHSWATQFHPEMNASGMKRRMSFYMNDGYFDKEDFERICAELDAADVTPAHQIVHNFIAFARDYSAQAHAVQAPAV
ncbi:glutamine amidotransferase [Corynebacterium ciconiae DSM 44920]|uniref:glutamine amidotransferase n=1 Tax=Corynebacterium ciconiae TaxID=227319 RepID=UPI00036898E7|nr:glutamine amidotransferase [Corynebacterium ciconiae]WKD61226.1 glutamine amidotransferase [Corynebacterium ciconiae DSM 44920]